MDYKNLHTSILKSIPFDDSLPTKTSNDEIETSSRLQTQLPNPDLTYQNLTLNELINEEEDKRDVIKILTGNKDLTLVLLGILILIITLVVLSYLTFVTWNEIQYLKTRLPKNF